VNAATAERITHRRVLNIAVPIMIANGTTPILGAVDTGVVGQLGLASPIGAVGLGAVIVSFLYWSMGFLRMGTSGLVAQAKGAGDAAETGALLMRALMMAAAAGAAFVMLQAPLFWLAFKVSPASAEVEAMTRAYLSIRIWGAPGAIAVYAITGWLIAMERTRLVLVLQIWMNGLNVALDLWFVLGLGWGVEGVAIASLIAELSGAALGLWMCREAFRGDQWRDWPRVFDRARMRNMGRVNGDIMIRSMLLQIGFGFFIFQSARGGDLTLAVNQILIQFLHITAYALDGFAFAAEALVGQALGAKRRADLRRSAILTSEWALGGVVLFSLAFWLLGPLLVAAMSTSEEVREAAAALIPWVAPAPLIGLPAWMLDGIFIGATRTREMRQGMIVSFVVYIAAWAVLDPAFGQIGLWLSLYVFFAMRALTLAVRYPALEAAAER
jgi:MATE family multidrug resistance protein